MNNRNQNQTNRQQAPTPAQTPAAARIAAFAVRDLGYEIEKSNANVDDILTTLQRIGLTRNNAIVGLPTELKVKS